MFQLDDKFLEDVGMADLPSDQKDAFLQHIYATLQERVGIKLSDGLSDAQLEEFEQIIDKDDVKLTSWLTLNAPNYQTDQLFINMQNTTKLPADDLGLKSQYASTKWLDINRPDYKAVVAEVLAELKAEIIPKKKQLLDQDEAQAA